MKRVSNRSLKYMSFIQAFSLIFYIGVVAAIMTNAERLFGKMPEYLGPVLFLTLFSTSALICGLITFYFPFILFWYKKQPEQAITLVFYTARWLILFTLIILALVILL